MRVIFFAAIYYSLWGNRDPKPAIMPSDTRRGTKLLTSSKLDSTYVLSKFDSPPPARPDA